MKYLIVCAKNPIFWVGAIMDATNLKNQIRLSNVWLNQNWIFRRKLNFFCSVYHCVYHKMPRIRIIMHLFLRLGLSHFFFFLFCYGPVWHVRPPKRVLLREQTQVTYITFLLGCLYMPRRVVAFAFAINMTMRQTAKSLEFAFRKEQQLLYDILRTIYPKVACSKCYAKSTLKIGRQSKKLPRASSAW